MNFVLISKYKNASSYITVKCHCGDIFKVLAQNVLNGSQKSCGCFKHKQQYRGIEELSGSYWNRVIKGARTRNIDFTINLEYVWKLFLKQERRCAISGVQLTMLSNWKEYAKNASLHTASLDRINNKRGYVKGNVRWVHKDVNWLRHKYTKDFTDKELIMWCDTISRYNKNGRNQNGTK